jgi:hypothetical protein
MLLEITGFALLKIMKIPKNYRGNQGLTLLAGLILFVLFIIFIGTIAYILWRAIQNIPARPPPPEEEAMIQAAIQKELNIVQANNPDSSVSVEALAFTYSPNTNLIVFIPFAPVEINTFIERSTNLINWEFMNNVIANTTFIDTNPPPNCAFYRRFDIAGNPVELTTNNAPGFYYVPQ